MAVGYSFTRAAQLAGVPLQFVEAAVKSGDIKAFTVNGTRCVNELGLAYLKGIAEARAETAGEVPADRRSAGGELAGDPSSWTDDTIKAKAGKIAAELKGSGEDRAFQGGVEIIRIPEGR